MALPVIDPLDLEKFPIVLNGAPLPLVGDVTGTATAANPAGLRLSGGNVFRDYTPWAEQEITDWSLGFGHRRIGDNGYVWGELDATSGNSIRLPVANSRQSLSTEDTPTSGGWNTYPFWESKIFEASNGKLYSFFGFRIYEYNDGTSTWGNWFDVRGTLFSNTDPAQGNYYIIDMCEFNGQLIVVTCPKFWTTEPSSPAPGQSLLDEHFDLRVSEYSATPNWGILADANWFSIDLVTKRCSIPGCMVVPAGGVTAGGGTYFQEEIGGVLSAGSTKCPNSMLCATACFAYGGFLFIGGSSGFGYTSGTHGLPEAWEFEGENTIDALGYNLPADDIFYAIRLPSPLNLSTKNGGNNWVTGFAGIQGQTIGDTTVYMTTTKSLYLCDLSIPTLVEVKKYDGENVGNGRGIVTYNNDLYIPVYRSGAVGGFPVGSDVIRFTASGQILNVGIDQTPYTPEVGVSSVTDTTKSLLGSTLQMASAPGTVMAGLYGEDQSLSSHTVFPKIVGLKGQGWHNLHARHTEANVFPVVRGLYYRAQNETVYYNLISNKNSTPAEVEFQRFQYSGTPKFSPSYALSGWMWLGYFDADSPLLQKDWHSISVYGDCLDDPDNTIEVYYEVLDTIPECGFTLQTGQPEHSFDVQDDATDGEYIIPATADGCGDARSGKYIAIAIRMETADNTQTPIIRGIKIKYFTPISDYFRFSYSVVLPSECLNDLCGVPLVGYVQADWDQALREAACSVEPVPFRDIDGKWYLVRVESESRRIAKVAYVGPPSYREHEISWSLVLTQLMNPSICEGDWEPACPA